MLISFLSFKIDFILQFQVVRLASFQQSPSVPPFLSLPKQSKADADDSMMQKETEERKANEIAVGGGGVSVAVTRFPAEQKRPVGPLVVVGVRDGVLWLIDRYLNLIMYWNLKDVTTLPPKRKHTR